MPAITLALLAMATALALVSLGGGLYEFLVVDPFWPRRPDLIQPDRGGISRRRFWIPAHVAFELMLIASLVLTWRYEAVRTPLLVAVGSHAVMRIWSAFDFIPKALAFERADPASISEAAARRWSHRSLGRLPLDLVTCGGMLTALIAAARLYSGACVVEELAGRIRDSCLCGTRQILGGRSTVGHRALDAVIGVRIPASQPTSLASLARWLLGPCWSRRDSLRSSRAGSNPCLPATEFAVCFHVRVGAEGRRWRRRAARRDSQGRRGV